MKFQQFMERSHLMGLYRNYQTFFSPLGKEAKKLGFNLNEALILLALFFETGKETNPKELATTLSLGKDQVSHALNQLESSGLIHRQLSKTDKRKRTLTTTALGKKQAALLIKVFDSAESRFEETLQVP